MKALQFSVNVPRFITAKALGIFLGNKVFYQGPFKTVQITDIPEPVLPSQEWAKIRTIYCGFCGSDLNLILLHDSPTASPFTSFPCVMGHEIVGEIIETGSGVEGFEPGDRVVINPALGCEARDITPVCPSCQQGRSGSCENVAEGLLAPGMFTGINSGVVGGFAPVIAAHKSQLFQVPDTLSSSEAVMAEPAAVAVQAVFDNLPGNDDTILVIGCGVIGNLIVQSLRTMAPGCHISVMEPSPFASRMATTAGADEIIALKEVFSRTEKITGARTYKPMIGMQIPMGGFTRIFDTVGISSTLNLSLRLLAAMGTLSVVGIGGDVKLDLTPLWLKLQTVKGVYSYGRTVWQGKDRHVFDIALELMEQQRIKTESLVTHFFKLDEYCRMIEANINKKASQAMKTVVSFDQKT